MTKVDYEVTEQEVTKHVGECEDESGGWLVQEITNWQQTGSNCTRTHQVGFGARRKIAKLITSIRNLLKLSGVNQKNDPEIIGIRIRRDGEFSPN